LAYLVGQVIKCYRWVLLARPLGFALPFKEYLSFYLMGMFFNLFTPGMVGGDVGRVFYLARGSMKVDEKDWKAPATAALVTVAVDRAIGLAVLVWIASVALVAFPVYALPSIIRYGTISLALGSFLGWMLLPVLNRYLRLDDRSRWKSLLAGAARYCGQGKLMLLTILLSLVVHTIQAGIQVLLGFTLQLNLPWSYCFILYPLVDLFTALPISLNGIGLREGGYLFLLDRIDVGSERAIAFGLLWFFTAVINSLIGGVIFALRKDTRPSW
ncbi:MAG TPA: lysylphosphatidylglycerol synthase transmembrane domain-containing protein, partial [Candidatus Binatia bacterium]